MIERYTYLIRGKVLRSEDFGLFCQVGDRELFIPSLHIKGVWPVRGAVGDIRISRSFAREHRLPDPEQVHGP